ncbi:M48 family metallopeptidase [uncultured Tistrella sp.]|uniref:M48 family metallopeptidase n=1 Tax=Tistrella mobilis TaxID=171437 RepID=UPI000C09F41E|nr:M48 family metallopeptidase [uncultured Tistrella sp.]MAM74582.1 metalloendopeptidase [Tistrella sp.]
MTEASGTDARAIFFDGRSARRRQVTIIIGPVLEIVEEGTPLARWAWDDIRRADGHGRLRLKTLAGSNPLARLEIADPGIARIVETRCPALDRGQGRGRTRQVLGWSAAACVSIVLLALYGIPFAADRITPLVPRSVEARLGDATDRQVRALLGGEACTRPQGQAALGQMVQALIDAGLPPEDDETVVDVVVLSSDVVNAIALPGGRIYVFDGLLQKAETPDELAGVIAHEIGHVHHRDGLRMVIRAGSTSFVIGLLFGDVAGGAAMVTAADAVLSAAYSRDAETAADDFSAAAMTRLGRSPAAFGDLLVRVTGETEGHGTLLDSHPFGADRLARLTAAGTAAPGTATDGPALLSDADWQALKGICGGSSASGPPASGPERQRLKNSDKPSGS